MNIREIGALDSTTVAAVTGGAPVTDIYVQSLTYRLM